MKVYIGDLVSVIYGALDFVDFIHRLVQSYQNSFGEHPMSSITYNLPLKVRANTATADTNRKAVALAERSAAFVLFQWH